MSFFSFLFGRSAKTAQAQAQQEPQMHDRRGKLPAKPTGVTEWAPMRSAATTPSRSTVGTGTPVETDRAERRDLLYRIVRETLMRCGVLAASYKFKVLSTDVYGRQFLVMLDVSPESASLPRFAEIEAQIVRSAKEQYDIHVSSTYWRVGAKPASVAAEVEPVKRTPLTRPVPLPAHAENRSQSFDSRPTELSGLSTVTPIGPRRGAANAPGRFEPIAADEVDAFKKALASAGESGTLAGGVLRRSGARARPPVDFEDTQVAVNSNNNDRRSPGLSLTQFGDLR